ncbi:MAG: VOC family protein [Oscillospiraceae bacterium]|nr:VOC family protein [Oscillospiraceae bacterium]
MEIKGIHHFEIITADIEKSLFFYNELGHLNISRIERSEEKDSYFIDIPNDGELELIDLKGKQIATPLPFRAIRFHHIAIKVDDPREYYFRFLPHVKEWPFILNHGDIYGHYAACPLDPDGLMIEWMDPYEPIPNNYLIEKDFSVCPGFHHFCIYAGDREATMHLYRDVLGMKLAREVLNFDMVGSPCDAYYFQVPGSGELEILDNHGVQLNHPIEPNHTGCRAMAFLVDDPQAFCDHLVKNGYEAKMEDGICLMYDPNGVLLKFIA